MGGARFGKIRRNGLRGLESDGVARCSIPKRHGLTSAFDPELLDDEGFVESGKPLRVV